MKNTDQTKVILITGAAKRMGRVIAQFLHQHGMRVIIHYHHSHPEALDLCNELNSLRENSAALLEADLSCVTNLSHLIEQSVAVWGYLDGLINNASTFFPTPIGEITEKQWLELLDVNLKAPFFLAQAATPWLKMRQGCIINISDIHADRPLKNYPVYSIAKAGLDMLTKALAKELAPAIRVNGIAPGIMIWPNSNAQDEPQLQQELTSRIALKKIGDPLYVAKAALFLMQEADYMTGQIVAVDGGRLLNC